MHQPARLEPYTYFSSDGIGGSSTVVSHFSTAISIQTGIKSKCAKREVKKYDLNFLKYEQKGIRKWIPIIKNITYVYDKLYIIHLCQAVKK